MMKGTQERNKMKRFLTLILIFTIALTISACGKSNGQKTWPDNKAIAFTDENMLKDVRSVTGISESDITYADVKDIRSFSNSWDAYTDITPLKYFTSLVELDISTSSDNLDAIGNLTNLETLEISGENVTDFKWLKNNVNLKNLTVELSCNITDLSGLEDLTNLEYLEIYNADITDLSKLKKLTNLKQIYFHHSDLTDLSGLENLTNLNRISISGSNVNDISALKNLTSLTSLVIGGEGITDISALENLTNITFLSFYGNNDIGDFSVLSNLTNLRELYIRSANINLGTSLSNLTKLDRVDLYGDNIADIASANSVTEMSIDAAAIGTISDMQNLTSLWIQNCESIEGLKNLPNVTFVALYDCENIKSIGPIENLSSLEEFPYAGYAAIEVPYLKELTFIDCENLSRIHIKQSDALEELTFIRSLAGDGMKIGDKDPKFLGVKTLTFDNCAQLRYEFDSRSWLFLQFPNLETLNIINTDIKLKNYPDTLTVNRS